MGLTPESLGVEPRNWHFKQMPAIILLHSKFEDYCIKGSNNINTYGKDPWKNGMNMLNKEVH